MRKREEKIQSIKVYIRQWLYDRMSNDIQAIGRFGSDESYMANLIDIPFYTLPKNSDGSPDLSKNWYKQDIKYLFSRSRFVFVKMIAELFIGPICAGWIALRCHATKLKRVQLGEWNIHLDNSLWFLFIGRGGKIVMINSRKVMKNPAFNWRNYHDIFQWDFIRNLKIVDSMIPWLKGEIQVTKKQVLIDRTIEKIEKAGKNPAPEK